ncbi:MAG TPA: PEP-CTERM sorting domain-containing protein [Bryobacteraceae bacterium]|jgi:hypothetical protein|nr:PEP-CTERM sorting domain-containing protein [Bryobacteraceae bacterium]
MKKLFAAALLVAGSFAPLHASFILQFDENGNGRSNDNGLGFVADHGFVLANDPTSTLHNVLVYLLPETVVAGDVIIADVTGLRSDLLRFTADANGNVDWLIFYSSDTGGGLLADTGLPSNAGTTVGATEDGTNHFDYNLGVGNNDYQGFSGNSVPEPATFALSGSALLLAFAGRKLLSRRSRRS